MPQSDDPQVQTMINNMPEKTGKSLDEWFALLKQSGLDKYGEMMKLLKGEHGVTHGFANTITLLYREQADGDTPKGDDLIVAQYSKKQELKPLYDYLIAEINEFGDDVEFAPKKAYLSLRRKKQFGIIQPSTKQRMDLGLNLKGVKASGTLIEGDKWSGMCSHRIELNHIDDIDAEVLEWLQKAYNAAS